jgi:hypothetical protein
VFRIVYSLSYQQMQQQFFALVQTHDPYSFQDLLMIHPYHADSLLQLSQVCLQTGEFHKRNGFASLWTFFFALGDYQMAGDFLERCIYCFQCSWHTKFAPHGPINCQLELTDESRYDTFASNCKRCFELISFLQTILLSPFQTHSNAWSAGMS